MSESESRIAPDFLRSLPGAVKFARLGAMSFKSWLFFLFLQIFGAAWAIWLFASPISRQTAGLLAGIVFLLVGAFPFWALRNDPHKGRWILLWSAGLFLMISAVPIFALRLLYWGVEFNKIEVFGIPAYHLHSWSESFYLAMLVATFVDGVRFFLLKKVNRPK